MNLKNRFKNYWKSGIIAAIICYLSFASPSTFNGIPSFNNEDKLIHFLMYAGLTIVMIYDYKIRHKLNIKKFRFILICILSPVALGGIIEIIQPVYFAPRTASWFDWLADIVGVLGGWVIMKLLFPKIEFLINKR